MIPILVVAAFLVVAAVVLIRRLLKDEGELARKVLLDLAPRLALPPTLEGGPCLRFDRHGFPASLRVLPGSRLNVEISFKLNGDNLGWITVSSIGFKRAVLEQVGLRDIQVGDAEFDERLEIWGSNREDVVERLQRDLRGLILQVDRRWDFVWRLTPDQLALRAHVSPLERFQIETLAGMAFQMLDLLGLPSPSDFILTQVQDKLDDETRCPVCGTPLSRGKIVRCLKCRGAHHLDCWTFNGLCATFACGSQLYER